MIHLGEERADLWPDQDMSKWDALRKELQLEPPPIPERKPPVKPPAKPPPKPPANAPSKPGRATNAPGWARISSRSSQASNLPF